MLRTKSAQKQCEIHQRNKPVSMVSLECTELEPSSVIKAMIRIIKIKTEDRMDKEARAQFSKITDTVVRMVEEIKE